MERNKDPQLAFGAIDCGYVKGVALELCQSVWGRFMGVAHDGYGPSVPRVVYWDNEKDWMETGTPFTDPAQLGAEAAPMLQFMQQMGVQAAFPVEGDIKTSYRDDL